MRMETSGAQSAESILNWTTAVFTGLMVDRIQIRWLTLIEGRMNIQKCLDSPCSG